MRELQPFPESAALAGEELARLLFECTDNLVCTLDLQGRFTSMNPAGERLSGYAAAELRGRFATEVIAPEHRDEAVRQFGRRLAGEAGSETDESVLLRRDGGRIPISVSSTVFTRDGQPAGVLGIIHDLSEHRRASEALERSEERFRTLLEAAPDCVVIVDGQGEIVFANERAEPLFGRRRDELLGQTIELLLAPSARPPTYLADTGAGQIAAGLQLTGKHRDGSEFPVDVSLSPLQTEDGLLVLAAVRDVSDREQVIAELERREAQLLEAQLRYRTLVEQLPLAMYIRPLDLGEPNIYVSPQVESMLGHPVEEWLSNPGLLSSVVHPEDRERVISEAQRVRTGGAPVQDECRYVRPDGEVVWTQDVTHLVRDEDGTPLYVQGFLWDITQRKHTEAERDRLRDELHHAQKLEALGRLAGGVAHDFNNMLTAIKGYSELLLDRLEPSSDAREEAAKIVHAAEQAAELPRQLLAFGRKQMLEPRRVDVNEAVASIASLLRPVISGTIAIVTDTRSAAPFALADPSELEHALVNLVLNASDAMPEGGTLTVATGNVMISEADAVEPDVQPGSYVVVSISDTGIGMDEETRRRAFEPFFTTKEPGHGSGLGLSSVYGTVTQSAGFVTLTSEPGRGTTFVLHLPVAAPAASVDGSREAASAPTVLVVEDEPIVRDLTERILSRAGYDVIVAADGEEALVLYRERRHELVAVVTDVVMPTLGGRELARRIREADEEIPIVFMSGHNDETPETLDVGPATVVLEKPFSPKSLAQTVTQLVEGTRLDGARSKTPITCLVADDHPAVLDAVSRFLEAKEFQVEQARDGDEALRKIESLHPEVALLDISMAPLNGIEVARRSQVASPTTQTVLYTGHHDRALLDQALEAGARGFVLKQASLDSLEEAVRSVAEGGTYVDAQLAEAIAAPERLASLSPLTARERQVLSLVADGLTNEKVAATLAISPETVQSHVRHAMVKLEADTRTEAVATALRRALIA